MRPITAMKPTNITNGEFAEMDDLIRQLTVIRSEMLELESSTMAEIGELHPTYRDSARNLLHSR